MDTPSDKRSSTLHSDEIQEAETAEPVSLDLLNQLARIQPADSDDETVLAIISNLIQMGQGE